jgi:alkanesulfonate monooxygenase SsuD/methylene tetrahydromethanopterin reductase-like flavin-dependent oxidoreductase (luciferase family)
VAAAVAERAADLGYHSLWSNDEPRASGLETLAHFATAAPGLDLGVGVLPIDRVPPRAIADEIARLQLDPARLWIGIGSGRLQPQLDAVRRAVLELRALVPDARIVVAAMRPRLSRLGGAIADGVLLNWMTPDPAARTREWVREGARDAGNATPVSASYIRVAFGDGADRRLRDEESRYRNMNEGSRQRFEAMGAPLGSVGIAATSREEVVDGLAPYHSALDLPIVRVLADRDAASLLAVVDAAAPA